MDDLVAGEVTAHMASWGLPAGRPGLEQMTANLRVAFPDFRSIGEDEITEKDKIAARWTICGTHAGSLWGNQPTGRLVVVQGFAFARMMDGQIAENWIFIDQMGFISIARSRSTAKRKCLMGSWIATGC